MFQEDVVLARDEEVAKECYRCAEKHCEGEATEVHETAVSEDAAVGVEDAER